MLTSSNILRHTPPSGPGPAGVAHTPTSLMLRTDEPMGCMFRLMYTNINEVATVLPQYYDAYGRREPVGPAHIPTSFLAGQPELAYFDLLNRDPDRVRMFMRAMGVAHRRVPTTGMFDVDALLLANQEDRDRDGAPARIAWVDLGGGDGHTLKLFRAAHPALRSRRCVVQDLPEVLAAAKEAAKRDEDLVEGVDWIPLDFHHEKPVEGTSPPPFLFFFFFFSFFFSSFSLVHYSTDPKKTGALVYYLRHILRDYSDPVCATILSNVRRSMSPDGSSRVLVAEQVHSAPPPLYAAFKDYSMIAIGGKERTLDQFGAVAAAAGLRVAAVHADKGTAHAVVEMVLA